MSAISQQWSESNELVKTGGGNVDGEASSGEASAGEIPSVDLYSNRPDTNAIRAVPQEIAERFSGIGCWLLNGQLTMAFAKPPTSQDLETLSKLLGKQVVAVLADPAVIDKIIKLTYYGVASPMPPQAPPPPPPSSISSAVSQEVVTVESEQGQGESEQGQGFKEKSGDISLDSTIESPNGYKEAREIDLEEEEEWASTETSVDTLVETEAWEMEEEPGESGVPVGVVKVDIHLNDILREAVELGASDIHLTAQMPPCIRIDGAIRPMEGKPRLNNDMIRELLFEILTQGLRERFEEDMELDTSHSVAGVGRFRVNVFVQRGAIGSALRPIPHEIPEFDTLGLPDAVRSFADLRRGLVLFTGPTGSGKSTSLAALIDIINRTKPLHIMSVEDPIEFLHHHKRSIVNQREVGQDTKSFAEALRHVLRQDPDVILVGEMRDLETISVALTAAETGHLVFATLHTQDAPQTIDRVIDVFPTAQQSQVRAQLGTALEGVVTQQLLKRAEGRGRAVVCEVMVCTAAVKNLIRSAKIHQIYSLLQTGGQFGMQTMDQALAKLVHEKVITEGEAFDRCHSEEDLRNHLGGV
ncbi:MAG: type IV pilus twitching motility protein PilT [Actinobacteria bacterium]|nr:type IV pilus twitching motility protein PilT [Actinomycetota bacterium]MCL6105144.1 type IV pilus twitching motility protein PilT [Actinomycetota bacterium]